MGGKPKAKDYSDENVQLLVNMGVPPQDAIDSLKVGATSVPELTKRRDVLTTLVNVGPERPD